MFIVTGFLGAGKTTLIRTLLESPAGAGTAVVVNEFGEVGIDQDLLRSSTETMALLGNGCVCCSMRSDLQQTLRDLWVERSRGQIPPFVRVIIETTGLADPGPILQTFLTDRALAGEFFLQSLIAVAAAPAAGALLQESGEAAKQLALADRIVLTKTDLASPAVAEDARAAIAAANPHAELAEARSGQVDPEFLLAPTLSTRRPSFYSEAGGHLRDISSRAMIFDEALDWSAFAATIDLIRAVRGADFLRLKGLVAVRGRPNPVVVQMAQHLAHPPVELTAWPSDDRRTRLVAITRDIDPGAIEALISAAQQLVPR